MRIAAKGLSVAGTAAIRRLTYSGRIAVSAMTRGAYVLPRANPLLATLNLTENCQSRCLMCDYWRQSRPILIDTERAVSLIGEFASLGIPALRFLGGEPLLRRDLFAILERVHHLPFRRFILATNGLLLVRLSDKVNRSCITNITVSIDGYGDDHDAVRGVPGGFERITEGLKLMEGKRIKVVALVTSHLARSIDQLLLLCSMNRWHFDIVLPSVDLPYAKSPHSVAGLEGLWPSEREAEKILTKVQDEGHISPALARAAREYLVERVYPQGVCALGYVQLQVRANGDLLTGCYELKPLGNVLTQSVEEILGSAEYQERLRRMLRMDCPGCVCGWQISYLAQRPLGSLQYIRSRMATDPDSKVRKSP